MGYECVRPGGWGEERGRAESVAYWYGKRGGKVLFRVASRRFTWYIYNSITSYPTRESTFFFVTHMMCSFPVCLFTLHFVFFQDWREAVQEETRAAVESVTGHRSVSSGGNGGLVGDNAVVDGGSGGGRGRGRDASGTQDILVQTGLGASPLPFTGGAGGSGGEGDVDDGVNGSGSGVGAIAGSAKAGANGAGREKVIAQYSIHIVVLPFLLCAACKLE